MKQYFTVFVIHTVQVTPRQRFEINSVQHLEAVYVYFSLATQCDKLG